MNETQTEADAQCPDHGCARWRCDADHITPGGLKPRAITVLGLLEHAECRTLNARTIAKHMGEKPSEIARLLIDMRALGLIDLAYDRTHEPYAARTWRLAIHTARRRMVRS